MLELRGITKSFGGREVIRDIDLKIAAGEVVGLMGRSGSGKSTLAKCIVGLETSDAGTVCLDGAPVRPGEARARQKIQYLWQDPGQSLSPYLSAHGAVMETLNGFSIGARSERDERATSLLSQLGLPVGLHSRRPHAMSGGQCQRVSLAKSLAAEPKVLILDEPLSSLDLDTQLRLIALLKDVRNKAGLAMLFVSHDLAPLKQLAKRILVLKDARITDDVQVSEGTRLDELL